MFDFHLHSNISFDSKVTPQELAEAAVAAGQKEICFTDHYDYNSDPLKRADLFTIADYRAAHDGLQLPGLTIRKGVEFGLTRWNAPQLKELLGQYPFDFVIGSVHYVDGFDPHEAAYWQGLTVREGFEKHLLETLRCVQVHEDFDVLGHLTYACKSRHNPTHGPIEMTHFQEIIDEILLCLIRKGMGMEVNTSGIDRAGAFLPAAPYLCRYKQLGGEIVTVGSDGHNCARVGQYIPEALAMLKEIFGYVCTFEKRKPIFHKIP